MKKVFLTAAIILLGGFSTYTSSAQTLIQAAENVIDLEEYKEIRISELPKAVTDALDADYNRATLEKAYVNSKQEYKLRIAVQEVTSAVHTNMVYADKYGTWIVKGKANTLISSTINSK